MDVTHLRCTQEADTKIWLHAVDVAARKATEISTHPPDTDVFILSRQYPQLCNKMNAIAGTGQRNRTIKLRSIVRYLSRDETAALPNAPGTKRCR